MQMLCAHTHEPIFQWALYHLDGSRDCAHDYSIALFLASSRSATQQQQCLQAASAAESNNAAICVLLWIASEDRQGMAIFPNTGGTQQQTC
jgi:hypothetical protein